VTPARSSLRHAPIAVWLIACVAALVFAYANRQYADTDILFAYAMLALTFPSGLIVAAALAALFAALDTFGIAVPGSFATSLAIWPLLVAIGYVQWFALVPRLFRRVRGA
jgi:hypothetical protein